MKWVVKTSTVRIADAGGDRSYRSIEDAPEQMRERIRKAIDGPHSQTILIANQEAYDHIVEQRAAPGARPFDAFRRGVRRAGRASRRADAAPPAIGWRALLFGGLGAIAVLWAAWLWAIRSGTS